MKRIKIIWKNRKQIIEGIWNWLVKSDYVEKIALKRGAICLDCDLLDTTGEGCMVPGTQPCCSERKGGCGCSLDFKLRSLSSDCPMKKWKAVMSEEEENAYLSSKNS